MSREDYAPKFSLYTDGNLRKRFKDYQHNITRKSTTLYNQFIENTLLDAKMDAPMKTGHLREEIKYVSRGYLTGTFTTVAMRGATGGHRSPFTGKMEQSMYSGAFDYGWYQHENQFEHYTTPGTGPHYLQNAFRKNVRILERKLEKDLLR